MSNPKNNQLTRDEIVFLINLIDVCSSRGSFKGEELLSIGSIRARLQEISPDNNQPEFMAEDRP